MTGDTGGDASLEGGSPESTMWRQCVDFAVTFSQVSEMGTIEFHWNTSLRQGLGIPVRSMAQKTSSIRLRRNMGNLESLKRA